MDENELEGEMVPPVSANDSDNFDKETAQHILHTGFSTLDEDADALLGPPDLGPPEEADLAAEDNEEILGDEEKLEEEQGQENIVPEKMPSIQDEVQDNEEEESAADPEDGDKLEENGTDEPDDDLSPEDLELKRLEDERRKLQEENKMRAKHLKALSIKKRQLDEAAETGVIQEDELENVKTVLDSKRLSEEGLDLGEDGRAISPIHFAEREKSPTESEPAPVPVLEPAAEPVIDQEQYEEYKRRLKHIFKDAAYFLIKSSNHENVSLAKAKGVWSTPPYNQHRIDRAFRERRNVILVFSVKDSRAFQGFARVSVESNERASPVRWSLPPGMPAHKLRRVIGLEWVSRRELLFDDTQHLRNQWNDNKPVKIGMDGQDIEPICAEELCRMFPFDDKVDFDAIVEKSKAKAEVLAKMSPGQKRPFREYADYGPAKRAREYRPDFRRGSPPHRSRSRERGGYRSPRRGSRGDEGDIFSGSYQEYLQNFYRGHRMMQYYPPPPGYPPAAMYAPYDYSGYYGAPQMPEAYDGSKNKYEQDVAEFLARTTKRDKSSDRKKEESSSSSRHRSSRREERRSRSASEERSRHHHRREHRSREKEKSRDHERERSPRRSRSPEQQREYDKMIQEYEKVAKEYQKLASDPGSPPHEKKRSSSGRHHRDRHDSHHR